MKPDPNNTELQAAIHAASALCKQLARELGAKEAQISHMLRGMPDGWHELIQENDRLRDENDLLRADNDALDNMNKAMPVSLSLNISTQPRKPAEKTSWTF